MIYFKHIEQLGFKKNPQKILFMKNSMVDLIGT